MSSFSHTDKSVQSQEQSVVAQPTRDTQTAQTAQPDAHTHAQASEPAKTSEPAIEFIDAEVQRAHRVIWSHGNFSIPTGSVTAIVGTNGTGKTTMLSTELGIIPLSSGRLRVLGAAPGRKMRVLAMFLKITHLLMKAILLFLILFFSVLAVLVGAFCQVLMQIDKLLTTFLILWG